MAELALENLSKSFGRVAALRELNLHVCDGELLALVGPSGCGKSTTLRLIAGLETPARGLIQIAGQNVNNLPPGKRNVAMTFQDHSLYPHMTVRKNLEFPLRMRRWNRSTIARHVDATAELLDVAELMDRKPGELSGGEVQRAALGRAIIVQPQVLLLDEPLSNLDATLRLRLRAELKTIQRQLNMTTIFVTHDQEEAMALGDRLAVMHRGAIVQVGTPMEVYQKPGNRFVAEFIGRPGMSILHGRLAMHGALPVFHDRADVHLGLERLDAGSLRTLEGAEIVLGVRPEHVRIIGHGRPCRDVAVRATVQNVELLGRDVHVNIRTAAGEVLMSVQQADPDEPVPAIGEHVLAEFMSAALHVFETGELGKRIG